MTGLFSSVNRHALRFRRRIAIGAIRVTPPLIASLAEAKKVADVVVVGADIPGFESWREEGEEAACDRMVAMLEAGQVNAMVRGQIYYTHYHNAMRKHFGFHRDVMCPYLIRDLLGNEYFLTPMVHHDDSSVNGRCYLARQAACICHALGVEPAI